MWGRAVRTCRRESRWWRRRWPWHPKVVLVAVEEVGARSLRPARGLPVPPLARGFEADLGPEMEAGLRVLGESRLGVGVCPGLSLPTPSVGSLSS